MGTRGTGSKAHHAAAYAEDEGSRARRRLPACRPEGDSSLTGCHQPAKQDKLEDTRTRTMRRTKAAPGF